MGRKRVFAGGLIAGAALTLALGGGIFTGVQLYQGIKASTEAGSEGISGDGELLSGETMRKLGVLEEMVGDYYLEDVSEADMQQGVYKGLIEALDDPYSVYYTPEELQDLQEKTEGIYYGIGARVSMDPDTQLPKIASVISGSPAEEAGILANDLLYKVDETEVQGMDLSSAVALVKGDEGTTVHLTVIRRECTSSS